MLEILISDSVEHLSQLLLVLLTVLLAELQLLGEILRGVDHAALDEVIHLILDPGDILIKLVAGAFVAEVSQETITRAHHLKEC